MVNGGVQFSCTYYLSYNNRIHKTSFELLAINLLMTWEYHEHNANHCPLKIRGDIQKALRDC